MNRFTLQQLRDLAITHNVPNRSKYTKKVDLYSFLVGFLGEDLDAKDPFVVKKSVFRQKKLTEYHPKLKTKPKLCVVTNYDYVVVQCLSTEKLFPMTDQRKNGDYYVNEFVCYFHGHDNDFNGVWAIHQHEQGPIGFKGSLNSPFKIKYLFTGNRDYSHEYVGLHEDGHWIVGEDTVIEMEDLEGWEFTPLIDPKIVGYEDILEEYGDYDVKQNSYLIEEYKEFAGKIAERSKRWNYVPLFVTHLRKVLLNRDLEHDNVVIFAGVPSGQIPKLKKHILASMHDESAGFKTDRYIPLEDGSNIVYLCTV